MGTDARSSHLLVVADETSYAETLADALSGEGPFRVTTAGSADEALDRIAADDVECVVSDHDPPGLDGVALLRALRAFRPDLPFVLFTAGGSEEVASRALHAGVTDYLVRRDDAGQWSQLATRIRRAIDTYRANGGAGGPAPARDAETSAPDGRLVAGLFEESPVGKVIVDTDGVVVRANERAATVLGRPVSDLVGRVYDGLDWDVLDEVGEPVPVEERPFSRVVATGEPVYGDVHAVERPDGERVWLSVNLSPVHDAAGDVAYLVAAMADITARKDLEEELRESNERHRLVLSNITDTVLITDDDGRFTYVCPNVHFIFGHEAEAVRELGTVDALLGRDPADAELEAPIENVELEVTDADGEGHVVLVTVVPTSIGDGTRLYTVRDITERKRQEERFRAFVEHSSDVVTVIDASGVIEYESPAIERVLGYDPDELVGENAFDQVHPDDRERVLAAFAEGIDQPAGTTVGVEYRARHRDGTWRWAESVATTRVMPEGGYVINTRDVTDQKAAEAALEERATNLEQAQAIADIGSWYLDIQADDLEWADGTYRIFGVEPDEPMTYERFLDLVHPADRHDVNEAWVAATEGAPYDVEHRILVDGEVRWVHERADLEFDADGRPLRGIGVVQDVTDRVRRERELRELDETRSLALEASNAGIWEWDLATGDVTWHESCERLFGLEPGTFEGTFQAFADRVHPDDLPDVEAAADRALDEGVPFQVGYRIQRDDGAERWVDSRGSIVTNGEAGHPRLLGVAIDVTRHHETIQQLRVLDRVLRHNLRNDLNVVRGFAEVIRDDASGAIVEDADHIVRRSDRLLNTAEKQRLITRVLTSDAEVERIDLVALVRGIVEAAGARHPEARLDLDLPPAATAWASTELGIALAELVENAIVHNERAEPAVAVTLAAGPEAVDLRIADDGPGIPEMERAVVTGEEAIEPLFHGSGLGLWLVAWVVRRSAGTLQFEPNEPTGSVVTVRLPTRSTR